MPTFDDHSRRLLESGTLVCRYLRTKAEKMGHLLEGLD